MNCNRILAAAVTMLTGILATSVAAQEFTQQQLDFFENKVRPILVDACFECHGPDADYFEGGLSLASRELILRGGDSGPAIDLDDVPGSLLIDAINYGDLFEMPPESKLPDDQIDILTKWVEMGAPWPDTGEHQVVDAEEFDVQKLRDEHWCWQEIVRPNIPDVKNNDWPRDELDKFILSKLEEVGLSPAKEAPREVWLRRVYFDLIGLPPTPEQLTTFVKDQSPDAYEKVVDELLASPRYGERWARHWMDLIRYAETCGHEFDYPIPHAYQYRDYLIRALNADVPYDQFITEHIAGDLMPNVRRNPESQINESVLGTGFWFLGEATHGPVDVKGDEAGRIDNQIDVVGKTFLGLTIACARCHDHKFDAISTKDYYSFSGFLQSSRRQLVMMDPNREIEDAHARATELRAEADTLLSELDARLRSETSQNKDYFDKLPKYVQATIEVLQADRSWLVPEQLKFEGEALKPKSHSGGKVQEQGIGDRGDFKWSGGKQLFWLDGTVGDKLELELNVPVAGNYQLFADFTTARDYGIIQVLVNGEKVGGEIDLYTGEIEKTGEQDFGNLDFQAGNNVVTIEIVGKNDDALPRHMAGIDYFRMAPSDAGQNDDTRDLLVVEKSKQHGLDADLLRRWISAIEDNSTTESSHPFHVIRRAAQSTEDLTSESGERFLDEFLNTSRTKHEEYLAWKTEAKKLADFDEGFDGWTRTGFGYSHPADSESLHFDMDPASGPVATAGTVSSGMNGKRFYGVLRSPTFEITHPFIHYRMKGSKAKIRLIVDGFVLDVNNPLLFHDFTFNFNSPDRFVWRTQKGDVKNYIGHRAHIEIIDHDHGDVEIDQIWMSNRGDVPEVPAFTYVSASGGSTKQPSAPIDSNAIESLSYNFAQGFAQRTEQLGSEIAEVVSFQNFVLRNRLLPDSIVGDSLDRLAEVRKQMIANDEATPRPKLAVGITDGSAEDEYVFIRGNHRNRGEVAERQPIEALLDDGWALPDVGSGRLELAQNIATIDNPLTARVVVNRLWHHLMGRGIVPSVDNFGVLGQPPTHPELLDFLATDFVNDGWSMKRMIRRIVLSQTYRMSSELNPAAVDIDPANQWLHRARVRRLQGEAIRDSMLFISGRLDTTMYGPGVAIHLTPFMDGRGRPGKSGPLDGNGRRTVYLEVRRNFLHPMMLAFDTPVPFNAIGRRTVSNVPAQALILLNDPFVVEQAGKWAERILSESDSTDERIKLIYQNGIGREPSDDELARAREFLVEQAKAMEIAEGDIDSSLPLWSDLCHVVFNMKEFIFIK